MKVKRGVNFFTTGHPNRDHTYFRSKCGRARRPTTYTTNSMDQSVVAYRDFGNGEVKTSFASRLSPSEVEALCEDLEFHMYLSGFGQHALPPLYESKDGEVFALSELQDLHRRNVSATPLYVELKRRRFRSLNRLSKVTKIPLEEAKKHLAWLSDRDDVDFFTGSEDSYYRLVSSN